jgi:hypothetical protein
MSIISVVIAIIVLTGVFWQVVTSSYQFWRKIEGLFLYKFAWSIWFGSVKTEGNYRER